jgi:hypothetical protein
MCQTSRGSNPQHMSNMLSCHLCRQHDPDAAVEGPECSVCRVQESPPTRTQDHSQNPGTKCADCAPTFNLPVQCLEAVSDVHYTIILLYFPRFIQLSLKPCQFYNFCRLSREEGEVLLACQFLPLSVTCYFNLFAC